jgi:hypothetical protein
MSLAAMLCSLSAEKLLEIQTAIIDAGICNEFKGDHKTIFKRLRNQSSGKQKKLYAALASADRDQMKRMADLIIEHIHKNQPPRTMPQPKMLETSV